MKDEIDYKNCTTIEELKSMIDKYMRYYNNYRYQWGLKKLTPVQYEATEKVVVNSIVKLLIKELKGIELSILFSSFMI